MSTSTVSLDDVFARTLPELAVPWQPEAAPAPDLVVLDEELAAELGLDPEHLRSPAGVRTLLGLELPPGARPVAQGYAGHQFGGYSPRLGDGRALLLGELRDREGRLRDLHLKGSGRTPWARGGDGLAGLGPMLREYVVSQGMHALGIPTTRSLAVLSTGRMIARETAQPGAVLARVAASHLRVGSFQYARALGEEDLLRRLVEHALERHHPDAGPGDSPALTLFDRVVTAQAELVARWMLVGFVHGVMNTDNMTVSGETIDYGPCAFLDAYDPSTVFSSIDDGGRYAFGNQPAAAQWNLGRFAEALLPLIHPEQEQAIALVVPVLEEFAERYTSAWERGMHGKLGLSADAAAEVLTAELLELMAKDRVDFTRCFRGLASAARGDVEPVRSLFLDLAGIDDWLARWRSLAPDAVLAERCNPVYIPRNHLVEEALDAAVGGDLAPMHQLLTALREPFVERDGLQRYAEPAPDDFGRYTTFCGT